jgi:hypothetical protein
VKSTLIELAEKEFDARESVALGTLFGVAVVVDEDDEIVLRLRFVVVREALVTEEVVVVDADAVEELLPLQPE